MSCECLSGVQAACSCSLMEGFSESYGLTASFLSQKAIPSESLTWLMCSEMRCRLVRLHSSSGRPVSLLALRLSHTRPTAPPMPAGRLVRALKWRLKCFTCGQAIHDDHHADKRVTVGLRTAHRYQATVIFFITLRKPCAIANLLTQLSLIKQRGFGCFHPNAAWLNAAQHRRTRMPPLHHTRPQPALCHPLP
jgi:hypothetical protein